MTLEEAVALYPECKKLNPPDGSVVVIPLDSPLRLAAYREFGTASLSTMEFVAKDVYRVIAGEFMAGYKDKEQCT